MKSLTKYTRIATLSAAALLMATPTLAQQTPEGRSDMHKNMDQRDMPMNQRDMPMNMQQHQSGAVDQPKATDEAKTEATAGATVALGQAVWSSDGEELGKVTAITQDANGNLESIHFVVGSTLGIGGKTVMTEVADFSQNKDRIDLKIDAKAANALPEVTE